MMLCTVSRALTNHHTPPDVGVDATFSKTRPCITPRPLLTPPLPLSPADQTTGATDDWARSRGVKYAFNPELRGTWFEVDASEIAKSVREFTAGVRAMATAIAEKERGRPGA